MLSLTRHIFVAAILIGIVSIPSTARSQTQEEKKERTGSVSGRVTINGKGAPGIVVSLNKYEMRSQSGILPRDVTDQDGNYRITGVLAGKYQVGRAASLRGSVKTAEGETMPGRINVHLVPAEKEKAQDVLRFLTVAVDADRKFSVSNVPPGRYFALATSFADDESITISKLRLPDEVEARAKLRLQAEAAKNEIELKPCQNLIDYELPLKSPAH